MGSLEDDIEDEILEAGKAIRELMRTKLCPGFVTDRESVAFTTPWSSGEDYRVGVFLYDIQDYSAVIPGYTITGGKEKKEQIRRFPPKAVELSYMIFCNEDQKFGGIDREGIQSTLNEVIRILYDNPVLENKAGGDLQLSFACLDMELKIKLWGSFHKAIQPAVYIKAVPVLIRSGREEKVYPVSERDYGVQKKSGHTDRKGD